MANACALLNDINGMLNHRNTFNVQQLFRLAHSFRPSGCQQDDVRDTHAGEGRVNTLNTKGLNAKNPLGKYYVERKSLKLTMAHLVIRETSSVVTLKSSVTFPSNS